MKATVGVLISHLMIRLTERLFLFVLICCLLAHAQTKPSQAAYGELLARLKSGDLTVDFKQLRLAWVDSPEYQQAKDTDAQKKAMVAAINSRHFDEALTNAETVLANEYVNIDAHFAEYIANSELHHDDIAMFHKAVVNGLLKSIMDSGDGKSPNTAFVVINTHEEYALLRFMRLMPKQQGLIHSGGHAYDKMDVTNPKTGESQTVYFNIDISMKHFGV